jgi:chaperone BCS1
MVVAALLPKLNSVYAQIGELSKANPVVAGAVSLWGLGVLTFLLKGVPASIWEFIRFHLTTTLTINSNDNVYQDFLSWVDERKINFFVRNFNFNNSSRYGYGKARMTVGYGTTFFIFSGKLMMMNRLKIEANQTAETKEVVTVAILGRNSKVFADMFNSIEEKQKADTSRTNIYMWKNGVWTRTNRIYKRKLETVTIPSHTQKAIVDHINEFTNCKEWYIENGIPYRTGIMFQGPPGTGKTSLIKAICSEFNKDLYICEANLMGDSTIRDALGAVPEGGVVALEEIDTVCTSRGPIQDAIEDTKQEEKAAESPNEGVVTQQGEIPPRPISEGKLSPLTLSGLLNALDGIICGEGRIVIATTNHPDRLDPALVREGRFDLKLHIGYMTDETLMLYMKRLYPNVGYWGNWKIKTEIAPCKVQKLVFDHRKDPFKVLKQVAYEVKHDEIQVKCCTFVNNTDIMQ